MINKLSEFLAQSLITNKNITKNERELYTYGFFILISHSLYFVLASLFGIIFKCFLETIIFYISFQFIRRYAGGYHAETELRCEIFSTLSIISCVLLIKISKEYNFNLILLCFALICSIIIFIFAPLDTPEKPLSQKEFKYFRKISLIILISILIAIALSYYFKIKYIFLPCCISLILEGILISAGKIKKQHYEKRANS